MSFKNKDELSYIVDEIASAAISMSQGAQGYDSFIRTRDSGLRKIQEHLDRANKIDSAIAQLHSLV